MSGAVALDVLVFGGGAAGLWTLDVLSARGVRTLLVETDALGAGQTVASQGIIHGGLKYTLQGLLTRSAANIREMPRVWRECLAGERVPILSGVRLRSDFCYLWRTEALSSRLGMLGASFGLQVTPDVLPAEQRPAVLAGCPGTVATLAEPVISPVSFVEVLRNRNLARLLRVDPEGVEFSVTNAGTVAEVRLACGRHAITLRPRLVVLAAGAGNAELLARLGRSTPAMQRRPLHMAMVRGNLPDLCGHCVDGAKTRVTITSERLAGGRVVWQLGGQIAEDGVGMSERALVSHAASELEAVLPGLDLRGAEWATYRVDRAEGLTAGGKRPDDVQISREGNVLTCWPTKLALVPELAREVARAVEPSDESVLFPGEAVRDWPRPAVAAPPWETATWLRHATPVAA
ncbi:MAG TPA: FAD-dependent oxidoreductase [Planctomycetaceae bacterium]